MVCLSSIMSFTAGCQRGGMVVSLCTVDSIIICRDKIEVDCIGVALSNVTAEWIDRLNVRGHTETRNHLFVPTPATLSQIFGSLALCSLACIGSPVVYTK